MNTNPQAVRILCYGDSLTYGRIPNSRSRYVSNVRRTGQLQNLLGSDYEIIEEGLRGRTTHLDNPIQGGKNGLSYFYPCILSHYPLDYIIILLGTNDLQNHFDGDITQSTQSFILYDNLINQACQEYHMNKPNIILVSPPYINSTSFKPDSVFTAQSEAASHQFATQYQAIAQDLERGFVDSATALGMGVVDGIHLNEIQNQQLAKLLYQTIINP